MGDLLRILMVTPFNPYKVVGGIEHVVMKVSDEMKRLGHELQIVYFEGGGENEISLYTSKAEIERRFGKPDVVHVHNLHYPKTILFGMRMSRFYKVVVTPHFHGIGRRRRLWPLWLRFVKVWIKKVRVHAVSEFEANLIRRYLEVEPVIIPHGIDEDVFDYSWEPSDYVLYSGRIEEYKRVEKLGEVVKHLNELGVKVKLIVQGEGSYKEELKRKLESIGIEFEMRGFVDRREYLRTLSKALLFGNLSLMEAYSIASAEALAMGVPSLLSLPWGGHFKHCPSAILSSPNEPPSHVAERVAKFLERYTLARCPFKPWSSVAREYLEALYSRQ